MINKTHKIHKIRQDRFRANSIKKILFYFYIFINHFVYCFERFFIGAPSFVFPSDAIYLHLFISFLLFCLSCFQNFLFQYFLKCFHHWGDLVSLLCLAICFKLRFLCSSPIWKFCSPKARTVSCPHVYRGSMFYYDLTPVIKF